MVIVRFRNEAFRAGKLTAQRRTGRGPHESSSPRSSCLESQLGSFGRQIFVQEYYSVFVSSICMHEMLRHAPLRFEIEQCDSVLGSTAPLTMISRTAEFMRAAICVVCVVWCGHCGVVCVMCGECVWCVCVCVCVCVCGARACVRAYVCVSLGNFFYRKL